MALLTLPTLPNLFQTAMPAPSPAPASSGNGNPITPAGGTGGDIYKLPELPTIGSFVFTSRTVFILLGILLIAGGIFSFDKTRDLIVSTAKAAKNGAELAASAA